MLEKAIEKLRTEIDQNKDNTYVQVVGDYLIKFLNKNAELAEMFLIEEKTIGKSLEKMKAEAAKIKKGNFAMFTLEEGLEVVLNYFGITTKPEIEVEEPVIAIGKIKTTDKADIKEVAAPKTSNFDIKLEDLIS